MSNVTSEKELQDSFLQQSRTKLIHYADAHTDNGLKLRLLNLIDEGLIEFNDVDEICKGKPQDCARTSCNFGLGELDDNRDLLIRNIRSNPDIIAGVLKTDTTGMFVGASKSYKTWHLIRLGLCVAHGLPWFGAATQKCKVLFVNPELMPNEFQARVKSVARESGIEHLDYDNFKSLSLHKRYIPPDDLMDAIENIVTRDRYELVILDSLYRLYGPRTDENSNADMLRLLTRMEKMISNPNMLLRCVQELGNETDKLNLFVEFRSDRTAKAVVQRAKSILVADQSYFSPTSKYQRIRGIELFERVARKFVDELLTHEPGQILRLADAYSVFREILKKRELPDIKRSDFKAVVGPLIRDQFNVALRNDLDGVGGRGWKGVKLLQSGPG